MSSIIFENGNNYNKRLANVKTYWMQLIDDHNQLIVPQQDAYYTGYLALDGSLMKRVPLKIKGNSVGLQTKELVDLPAGDYQMEVWAERENSRDIFPNYETNLHIR